MKILRIVDNLVNLGFWLTRIDIVLKIPPKLLSVIKITFKKLFSKAYYEEFSFDNGIF